MGDVLMTTPAFRALKETFNCRLTLLTSEMGSLITPFIKEISETIVFNLPWVKTNNLTISENCLNLIKKLKDYAFDGAIIFTVYSQSSLPSSMLAYMAGIPLRLAYCRENPYELLTEWVPDKEPFTYIHHQVERDLSLVKNIGAKSNNTQLSIAFNENAIKTALHKLNSIGFNTNESYIIIHAGVSEKKREYPEELWIETIKQIYENRGIQILLTGSENESVLTQRIKQTNQYVFSAAGILNIEEFIAVIAKAKLVVSVNTATVHIAAAVNTPVIVLYALTNPQHTPWKTKSVVLPFSVPAKIKSKNEVISFVDEKHFNKQVDYPSPEEITQNVVEMINETKKIFIQD